MNRWVTGFVAALVLGGGVVQAQEAPAGAATPLAGMAAKNPKLARMYTGKEMHQLAPVRPEKIVNVRTGEIRQQRTTYADGQHAEMWTSGPYQVRRNSYTGEIKLSTVATGEGGRPTDFPELSWVSEKNVVETKTVDGAECRVFVDSVPVMLIEDPEGFRLLGAFAPRELQVEATATISATTGLPVSLEWGENKRTYTFGPPPQGKLVLPKDMAATVRQSQERAEAAIRPLATP